MSNLITVDCQGGDELDRPETYTFDPTIYADQILKAREALATTKASCILFYWCGEGTEAYFSDCLDWEGQEDHNIDPYNGHDAQWEGPHLRVTDSYSELYWEAKYGNEKFWIEVDRTYTIPGEESCPTQQP